MSRSYKKHPWCCDKPAKGIKRCANSKVRSALKDPNVVLKGSAYKKVFESWDICDYFWYGYSFESYYQKEVAYWYEWRHRYYPFPNREECWKDYVKYYLMK